MREASRQTEEPEVSVTTTHEQRWDAIAGHDFRHGTQRWHQWTAAQKNADATAEENDFPRLSESWYEIAVLTYRDAVDFDTYAEYGS